ncbi:hypothetical protein HPB49_012571 [Dermacentor silvarum]|uniref:Uncharacterized protein n=1 Tax=Dermacentor silvarum TaxID=543639 RepID=A0ACB8D5J3_DERSI|nr:hypothetical protein HPB49_012571 [Dermacentor silvarum]
MKDPEHRDWDANLKYVECSLNNAVSKSSGKTPYEMLHGYIPVFYGLALQEEKLDGEDAWKDPNDGVVAKGEAEDEYHSPLTLPATSSWVVATRTVDEWVGATFSWGRRAGGASLAVPRFSNRGFRPRCRPPGPGNTTRHLAASSLGQFQEPHEGSGSLVSRTASESAGVSLTDIEANINWRSRQDREVFLLKASDVLIALAESKQTGEHLDPREQANDISDGRTAQEAASKAASWTVSSRLIVGTSEEDENVPRGQREQLLTKEVLELEKLRLMLQPLADAQRGRGKLSGIKLGEYAKELKAVLAPMPEADPTVSAWFKSVALSLKH